ncbi:sodium:proton antiporter [cf. Phormidesmis sp. LEGE 11477]|uniref:cation:proton antiporter n=1 Tax=cf. Phormidesmis sp. LEGE 11477 TaxID=1828680 RepID=UPI0018820D2B|nr:cation:proton antiporter [cf. Phormidesmis sp. LEGE 11477]MBE9062579.1 cation:proton antiporter [cf. Phormidesmis sp. LEGE 11477]
MDPKIILYITFGLSLLGLTWLPNLKGARFISVPLLYFFLAALLFSQVANLPLLDPIGDKTHAVITEYITELIVIISLAGAGLAIDRKFRLSTWQSALRLLCVSMPICIAGAAFLGHWIFGLSLADAILLGACLAPTDPVMAHSVQVGPPNKGGEDPARFSLTAEAGLNDGLAFPFVYLALGTAEHQGKLGGWLLNWTAYDLIYRVAMGTAVGIVVGLVLSHYAFRVSDETVREETREGLFVVSAIFLSYGLAEAVSGYGFLAVFAAAVASRQNVERFHEYHSKPYQFATQLERIFAGLLLLALGGFVATADLELLTWSNFLFAGLFMLVVRPLSGRLSLLGLKLSNLERNAIAFLGIRGFGSFYYLAYAQNNGSFDNIAMLWSIVTLTVILSFFLHDNTATIAMRKIDRQGHQNKEEHEDKQKDPEQSRLLLKTNKKRLSSRHNL